MSETQPPGDRAIRPEDPSIFEAIRVDLGMLHARWMSLVFPRQLGSAHSVLGRWKPKTTGGMIQYRLWGLVGGLIIALVYPLAVVGLAIRFYSAKIDRSAASLGLLGVFVLSIIVWGALTVVARFRFSFEGFIAVAAAGGVATLSAVLAYGFSRVGGRGSTVLLAYPFAVTAIFLPPVVAAFYSPTLAAVVFPNTQQLSTWFLVNVFDPIGLGNALRYRFSFDSNWSYVGMWFALAIPVGWLLGVLVTLADLVRPSTRTPEEEEPTAAS